jgi:hypothetical protein
VSTARPITTAEVVALVHNAPLVELLSLVLALDGEVRERAIPGSRELQNVAGYFGNMIRAEHGKRVAVASRRS